MNDLLYDAWVTGGKETTNMRDTKLEKVKRITGNHAKLENVVLEPKRIGLLTLRFNFLTQKVSEANYTLHAIQRNETTNKIQGGETYLIKRDPRNLFLAKAGEDKVINENEAITIQADTLNEPATYNWYDPEGNLIYTGKDFTVSSNVTKKYKLEIIADSDGYKDYDEIEIKINGPSLNSLSPNPTSGLVMVGYDVMDSSSAYISVHNLPATVSDNYILDVTKSQIEIDVSGYPAGVYVVTLVCDGEITDSKNLLKE